MQLGLKRYLRSWAQNSSAWFNYVIIMKSVILSICQYCSFFLTVLQLWTQGSVGRSLFVCFLFLFSFASSLLLSSSNFCSFRLGFFFSFYLSHLSCFLPALGLSLDRINFFFRSCSLSSASKNEIKIDYTSWFPWVTRHFSLATTVLGVRLGGHAWNWLIHKMLAYKMFTNHDLRWMTSGFGWSLTSDHHSGDTEVLSSLGSTCMHACNTK